MGQTRKVIMKNKEEYKKGCLWNKYAVGCIATYEIMKNKEGYKKEYP